MPVARDVATERRAASDRLVHTLSGSDDPVLAYKARLLEGTSATSAEAHALQARIPGSPAAHALLRVLEQDEKTLHHTYRKWQGPRWTLTCLALIDYPPGDETLRPLTDRVHDWLRSRRFLYPPMTAIYPGQEGRVRHCASIDGNAIWYSVRLGLEDERTRGLVDRLIGWQWPDGRLELRQAPQRHLVVVPGVTDPGAWPLGVRTSPRPPPIVGRRTEGG